MRTQLRCPSRFALSFRLFLRSVETTTSLNLISCLLSHATLICLSRFITLLCWASQYQYRGLWSADDLHDRSKRGKDCKIFGDEVVHPNDGVARYRAQRVLVVGDRGVFVVDPPANPECYLLRTIQHFHCPLRVLRRSVSFYSGA